MYNIMSIALPQPNPTSTPTLTQLYLKCLVGDEILCLSYQKNEKNVTFNRNILVTVLYTGSRERTGKEVRKQKAELSRTLSRKAKENATRGGSNPSIKLFFKSLESTKADDAIQKKSQDLNTPIILGKRKSND